MNWNNIVEAVMALFIFKLLQNTYRRISDFNYHPALAVAKEQTIRAWRVADPYIGATIHFSMFSCMLSLTVLAFIVLVYTNKFSTLNFLIAISPSTYGCVFLYIGVDILNNSKNNH